jgi:hypothetical protein
MYEAMRMHTPTRLPPHWAPIGNRILAQGGRSGSLYRRVLNETSQVRIAPALTVIRSLQSQRADVCSIGTCAANTRVSSMCRQRNARRAPLPHAITCPMISQVDHNLLEAAARCDDRLPWAEHWISATAPRCADGSDALLRKREQHSAQGEPRTAKTTNRLKTT